MHQGIDLRNDQSVPLERKQHKLFVVPAEDRKVLWHRLLSEKQYQYVFVFHPMADHEKHLIANGLKQNISCAVIATPEEVQDLDQFTANNLGAPEHWSCESACKSSLRQSLFS